MKVVFALVLLGLLGLSAAQVYDKPYGAITACKNFNYGLNSGSNACTCTRDATAGSVDTATGDLPPPLSIFDVEVSGGNLILKIDEDIRYFYPNNDRPDLDFYDDSNAVIADSDTNCYSKFVWTVTDVRVDSAANCLNNNRRWTGTALLTDVINIDTDGNPSGGCFFEMTRTDAEDKMKFNLAVRNVEFVPLTGSDGANLDATNEDNWTSRLIEHALPFELVWTRQIDATISLQAKSVIDFGRAIVKQAVARTASTNDQATLTIQLIIDINNPYQIYNVDTATETSFLGTSSPDRTLNGWTRVEATDCNGDDLEANNAGTCFRTYEFTVDQKDTLCDFQGSYKTTFYIKCLDGASCPTYTDGVDRPSIEVTFTVGETQWCPIYTDSVELSTSMNSWGIAPEAVTGGYKTYLGREGTFPPKTDFLHGQTMYFIVSTTNTDVPMVGQSIREASITNNRDNLITHNLVQSSAVTHASVDLGNSAFSSANAVFNGNYIVSYFAFTANSDSDTTEFQFPLGVDADRTDSFTVTATVDITYDIAFETNSYDTVPVKSDNMFSPSRISKRRRSLRMATQYGGQAVRTKSSAVSTTAAVSGTGNTRVETSDPTFVANSAAVSGAFALVACMALAVAIVATMKRKSIEKRIGDEIARSSSSNNMMLGEMSSTNSESN